MRTARLPFVAALVAASALAGAQPMSRSLDREAERWVQTTLKHLSLEERVGQMIVSSFQSNYLSTDSAEFDELVAGVHEQKLGGFHVFGGSERVPAVLLNPTYGSVT